MTRHHGAGDEGEHPAQSASERPSPAPSQYGNCVDYMPSIYSPAFRIKMIRLMKADMRKICRLKRLRLQCGTFKITWVKPRWCLGVDESGRQIKIWAAAVAWKAWLQ